MTPEHIKSTVDGASIFTAVATVFHWLPEIAALFSIVWTGIRVWEWFKNRK